MDELARAGIINPARLYEPPFSDVAPTGVRALFDGSRAIEINKILLNFLSLIAAYKNA